MLLCPSIELRCYELILPRTMDSSANRGLSVRAADESVVDIAVLPEAEKQSRGRREYREFPYLSSS